MRLFPGEPAFGPWRAEAISAVLARTGPGTRIVAVDGRSAGGKTTCATRLAATVPGATVVHTDDVAWYEAFFDWARLLRDGVLAPVRAGEAVAFRPPAWERRGRDGAIEVPASCPLLVVEGVGVSRRELSAFFDLRLWVQSDRVEARRRGIERDGGTAHEAFWDEWDAEEIPFLAADRPWERADLIVAGGAERPYDPATELLVAEPRMNP
ncbi:MAG TPA: hypothetical protein VLM05_06475 [Mycobacteriales bacterium]|nr:hypothetical protein [Mycobacteriales bacterium]